MTSIFINILNLAVSASFLIVAVMLLRLMLKRRAPRWVVCLLWGVVALRLVFPFRIESEFSLVPNKSVVPEQVFTSVAYGTEATTEPAETEIYTAEPARVESNNTAIVNAGNANAFNNRLANSNKAPASAEKVKKNGIAPIDIASVLWIVGVAVMMIYALANYLLLRRRLADSVPYMDGVRQSDAIASPFVLGLFRPKVYMPFGISKNSEEYVIKHEKSHIKRRDHWIKPIGFLILSVYWFNPLVWAAYILLCNDIEYACDERVFKKMPQEERRAYAKALVECSVRSRRVAACPVAFGETGVKGRVKRMLNFKKPTIWVILISMLAGVVVSGCFGTVQKGVDYKITIDEDYDITKPRDKWASYDYSIGLNIPKSTLELSTPDLVDAIADAREAQFNSIVSSTIPATRVETLGPEDLYNELYTREDALSALLSKYYTYTRAFMRIERPYPKTGSDGYGVLFHNTTLYTIDVIRELLAEDRYLSEITKRDKKKLFNNDLEFRIAYGCFKSDTDVEVDKKLIEFDFNVDWSKFECERDNIRDAEEIKDLSTAELIPAYGYTFNNNIALLRGIPEKIKTELFSRPDAGRVYLDTYLEYIRAEPYYDINAHDSRSMNLCSFTNALDLLTHDYDNNPSILSILTDEEMQEYERLKVKRWVERNFGMLYERDKIDLLARLYDSINGITGREEMARKEDESRIPEDFAFYFTWNINGNCSYDSATQTVNKDKHANKREFVAHLELEKSETAEIYDLMNRIDIFSYPEINDMGPMSKPGYSFSLKVTMNGETKTIYCRNVPHSPIDDFNFEDEKTADLYELCRLIRDTITGNPVWQELPEDETIFW